MYRIKEKNVIIDIFKKYKVNYVVLVIDKFGLMQKYQFIVVCVVDEFVKGFKEEFDVFGYEIWILFYVFDYNVECLVWDMDVKVFLFIWGFYCFDGVMLLIQVLVFLFEDLKSEIFEKYGEYFFFQVVWIDGEENVLGYCEYGNMYIQYGWVVNCRQFDYWLSKIQLVMGGLLDYWIFVIFVFSLLVKWIVQGYGFLVGNIVIWDVDMMKGVEEVIGIVKVVVMSFLCGCEVGVCGIKNFFVVGQDFDVNVVCVVFKLLDGMKYWLLEIKLGDVDKEICLFVQEYNIMYKLGMVYYQFGSCVIVQVSKNVVVFDMLGVKLLVYIGFDVLCLVFGDENVGFDGCLIGVFFVKVGYNLKLWIFVQLKSVNWKLKRIVGEKEMNFFVMF